MIERLAAASALSGLEVRIALTFNFPGKAAARDALWPFSLASNPAQKITDC
ncbi:hypothetical protein JQ634_30765 [Bradyrhizobium sp. AUGA SZCCT0240]|uniref:hypothetical protein n=1 Tax=unclassified Bradyrhizobium TaxID=2631580 RepID=UPI001BA68A3B|nr:MULTISPECIES: hypothetical protein [unclassified Bradyrhizobium]MBR1193817.1 hypothetical protein [Bradyrhizobium sp. AUGA SZCCT0160]MBR1199999.1 hypothetical protein [Bradyrhizobium sp. AUGA SZCCT0158]MBR1244327.1 hypothetical protein [Bradyrhizobium sp. AUGA SZCCT0274]MBR1258048.1 hypothetical protein [Bradyrhizobium sp. AUGA SZCCT0240]